MNTGHFFVNSKIGLSVNRSFVSYNLRIPKPGHHEGTLEGTAQL